MNKRNGLLRLASAALAAALCLTACGAPAASSSTPQPTETPAAVGGENVTLGGRDAQGQNGVVSTGRAEATQIGVDVLKAGGNAVDAAVAIGFALGVCEQQRSSSWTSGMNPPRRPAWICGPWTRTARWPGMKTRSAARPWRCPAR